MSQPSSSSKDKIPSQLKSYKVRWIILALTTFYLFAVGYGRACFGVVENVYASYFLVSVEAVDWLTLSMSAVGGIGSLLILFVLPVSSFGCKIYCRVASVFLVLSFGFHLASSWSRSFFSLALAGQLAIGITGAIAVIIIPEVAALWFPKEEIATAVGIALGGIAIGNMVGFLLPSHLLQRQEHMTEESWTNGVKRELIIIFSVLLCV